MSGHETHGLVGDGPCERVGLSDVVEFLWEEYLSDEALGLASDTPRWGVERRDPAYLMRLEAAERRLQSHASALLATLTHEGLDCPWARDVGDWHEHAYADPEVDG